MIDMICISWVFILIFCPDSNASTQAPSLHFLTANTRQTGKHQTNKTNMGMGGKLWWLCPFILLILSPLHAGLVDPHLYADAGCQVPWTAVVRPPRRASSPLRSPSLNQSTSDYHRRWSGVIWSCWHSLDILWSWWWWSLIIMWMITMTMVMIFPQQVLVETFPLRLADDSWHRLAVVVSGDQIEVSISWSPTLVFL